MTKRVKKVKSEYNIYFKLLKTKIKKDFEKEHKDLLLFQLLTALNNKDVDQASHLYEEFKEALS